MKTYFPGVYKINARPATLNRSPGNRVYDEKLIKQGGQEYRSWDPFRSKISAGILKGIKTFPITDRTNVLYLGASSGTTASHIADITSGMVYCIEFSKRMMRELVHVCEARPNMVPVLADARRPHEYSSLVAGIDVVIQDVAQPNQIEILDKNMKAFKATHALLSIKARSIDSVRDPRKVFKEEVASLKEDYVVLEALDLKPFEKDHVLVNLKTKNA